MQPTFRQVDLLLQGSNSTRTLVESLLGNEARALVKKSLKSRVAGANVSTSGVVSLSSVDSASGLVELLP